MDELPGRTQSTWDRVRGHALVRAAIVFGSAVFFVLQLLDLLGVSATAIRALAIVFAAAFVVAEGFYLWKSWRPAAALRAPERLRRWVLGGSRWVGAALVLLVLGGLAWFLGGRLIGSPVRPGTDVIAVMPFIASGDQGEELRIGMVSLLSSTLDQVGGLRTTDPGTVLHGWDRRAGSGTLDLQGALQVGRDVGAGAILWGSIAAVRGAVQVTGEIYTVDGQRVAQRQERGDVNQLHAVIDRLSVQLLREIWRSDSPVPDLRIGAITTESPQALRAFLRGERYYRAAQYDSAVTVFEEAVRADSMFALAYFRLSWAYGNRAHGAATSLRVAESAHRLADRLPERERSLATAQLLHTKGDFAALDSIRAIIGRYPDDALAWYLFSDVQFHTGNMLQPPVEEIIAPSRRALELDPAPGGGASHMLREGLFWGDRALFDEFLVPYRAAAGTEETAPYEALARIRWAPADSLIVRAEEFSSVFIQERAPIPVGWYVWLVRSTDNRFATEMKLDPDAWITFLRKSVPPAVRDPQALLRALVLADLGRVREASRLLDTAFLRGAPFPGAPPPPLIRTFWGMTGLYPADSLPAQFALLAQDTSWGKPVILRYANLARADLRAADAIQLPPLPPDTATVNVDLGYRIAVDAIGLQLRGDTTGAVVMMRNAIRRAGYSDGALQPFTWGPLFKHAVALSVRADTRAEGIRRLRSYLYLGSASTVPAYLALANALEAQGDRAGAAEAYAHVIRLWKNADPHLQPVVKNAREALRRLTGEK